MPPSSISRKKKGKGGGGKGGGGAAVASVGDKPSTSSSEDFAGLVPSSADEFRSLEFWDGFFKARGEDNPFEWYGDWRTLKPLLLPLCSRREENDESDGGGAPKPRPPASARVLMLGCGNSELSAQMYDSGVRDITNVDFCPAVIRSMLLKNARARPEMRWLVGDMTALPENSRHFPVHGFDVVVDKGGLDALHSEEDDGASGRADLVDLAKGGAAAAVGLAATVRRVLRPGGSYCCVTLGQKAVLAGLLASYRLRGGWGVRIESPPPPPDMASAPLQPLLVVVTRPAREGESSSSSSSSSPFSPVSCRVPPPRIDAPNAEQLSDVFSVVEAENEARRRGEGSAWVDAADRRRSGPPPPATPAKGASPPSAPSPRPAPLPSFDDVVPGREVEVLLPQRSNSPRFVATVVDRGGDGEKAATKFRPPPTCSVFLVPQGREHEWLFSSSAGRATVASQVGADRCVFVSAARGAPAFPELWGREPEALQRDLGPHVAPLAPLVLRGVPRAVPFVTLGEGAGGLGRKPTKVLEVGAGSSSDETIVVEDVECRPDEEGNQSDFVVVGSRRLVFAGARSLIQSEVPLVVPKSNEGESDKGAAPKPRPALSTHLPSAYHCAILAGLALLGGGRGGEGRERQNKRILVVGLGAGGLAAHLASERRCDVTAVELDGRVVDVAREHFGLREVEEGLREGGRGSLSVIVGDGVAEVERASSSSSAPFSAIVVDAGGGDATLAMSCPPPAFATEEFAALAASALRAGEGDGGRGVLAVNCVSRDLAPVASLATTLKRHFSRVFEIDVPEDVNRVLFAAGAREGGSGGGREEKEPVKVDEVSTALDEYFLGESPPENRARDPGDLAGGCSVAEMADLLAER